MKLSQQPQIDKKIFGFYHKNSQLLKKARVEAISRKIPVIDDNTGYFLSLICTLYRPHSIIEIGCGTGYSTYYLLKDLDYSFSYTGIDLNKKRLQEAERFIGNNINFEKKYLKKLKFIHGDAIEIIPEINQRFDLVFIDAAKYQYLDYLIKVKEKLREKSIVIADDIFYKNKVFKKEVSQHDYNSIKGLMDYLIYINESKMFKNYFFNIGDGIALSKYKSTGF